MKRTLIALGLLALTGCNTPAAPPRPTATSAAPEPTASAPVETATPVAQAKPFMKLLELQDHSFEVNAIQEGDTTTITMKSSGPDTNFEPVEAQIQGVVTDAEIEDLNSDGFPEVYIYAVAISEKKEGILVAYSSNQGKSLSQISVPALETVEGAADGYTGGDEFRVVETTVVQRYPVGEGKTRQIQWKLEPGEATWVLVADKVTEY